LLFAMSPSTVEKTLRNVTDRFKNEGLICIRFYQIFTWKLGVKGKNNNDKTK